MVWGGDVGFGLLRVPQLCAKPYPAEPRCDICGLPRGFFILERDWRRALCFRFLFLGCLSECGWFGVVMLGFVF